MIAALHPPPKLDSGRSPTLLTLAPSSFGSRMSVHAGSHPVFLQGHWRFRRGATSRWSHQVTLLPSLPPSKAGRKASVGSAIVAASDVTSAPTQRFGWLPTPWSLSVPRTRLLPAILLVGAGIACRADLLSPTSQAIAGRWLRAPEARSPAGNYTRTLEFTDDGHYVVTGAFTSLAPFTSSA